MPVETAFTDAYNLAGILALRRLGQADKDLAGVHFGNSCDGATYTNSLNPLVAVQKTAANK
jgi:hypothetical protein